MCTSQKTVKIELDVQDFMLVEYGLLLYESKMLNSLIELSPEQFGSFEEDSLRSQLESVKKLLNIVRNKEVCYGF